MKAQEILLVCGSKNTEQKLEEQLLEYLPSTVKVNTKNIEEGINTPIDRGLVVFSSQLIYDELFHRGLFSPSVPYIIGDRTIDPEKIDQIVLLKKGTKVLFVNDNKVSTKEGINDLSSLGIDYLEYIPYYPNMPMDENSKKIDIAITLGEIDKVPATIKKTYNMGSRIFDFTTIVKLLNRLEIIEENARPFSLLYLKKIVKLVKSLSQSTERISSLNTYLNLLIDGLKDGLIVYDRAGNITYTNEVAHNTLENKFGEVKGKNLKDFYHDRSLLAFLMQRYLSEEIFHIDGKKTLVSKFSVPNSTEMIARFREENTDPNRSFDEKFVKKGYYAKHTFDDILGSSVNLLKAKKYAEKLGKTDLNILIEGESGTGKEVFASAIHNVSKRCNAPYIAVNFNAIKDELIESELFGYEEGSFTGAKKGGKIGLFEQAQGGTIFLDEIGDATIESQTKLLRVLQEKEVMRIGGEEIISVDVRVIAATNKDLKEEVARKRFRKDLYYRLKVGYLKVPPLRERREDVPELFNFFLNIESSEKLTIKDEVCNILKEHYWDGNIRELQNLATCIAATLEGNEVQQEDLEVLGFEAETPYLDEINRWLLDKIHQLNEQNILCGRRKLLEIAKKESFSCTEGQIRSRLQELSEKDYILKKRGNHGTVLTDRGIQTVANKS